MHVDYETLERTIKDSGRYYAEIARANALEEPGVKLAVVGGGSTYTPELVDGLVRMRDLLPLDELALHDPNEERLDDPRGPHAADARPRRPPGAADRDRHAWRRRSRARTRC